MASQISPPPPKHPYTAGDISIPPAKRQRVSPTPGQYSTPQPNSPWMQSPTAGSPTVPYLSLPGQNPTSSFYTPQPVQPPHQDAPSRFTPGVMGPPERPADKPKELAEKATDVNDLSDIVTASGIDLKEEENYLLATYRNRQNEFSQSTSFGTTTPTISPNNSFRQWSQGSLVSQPAFQGVGPLSQPAVPQKNVEDEVNEKHKQAARRLAESKARHLQSPFLNVGDLRNKINWKSYQNQVRYGADGRVSVADPPRFYGTTVACAEGIGIVGAKGTGIVHDRSLEDILSLMSLATEQRLRDLVEDAVGHARSRRYGSHGLVPPEWTSLATGTGEVETTAAKPQSLSGTAWDRPVENAMSPTAGAVAAKQPGPSSAISPTLPTPPSSESPSQPTVAFKAEVPPALRSLGADERQLEQKRIAARKKRLDKERQGSIDAVVSPSTPGGPGTPGTPATTGSIVPETKLTKKEREKQAKQVHQTEEVMRQQANQTAALALGGRSKYSWMNSASTATAGSGFGTGAGAGRMQAAARTTSAAGTAAAPREEDRGLRSKDGWKGIGEFREDGLGGKAVQLRDVVVVLERDGGVESKSLTKAYWKMKTEKQEK